MSWPYIENDFMEIGNSGWVAIGENIYKNMSKLRDKISENNNHINLLNLCVEFFLKLNKVTLS